MNPLYKWSGGKRREISLFNKYYPNSFELFIEPFFGAGAVFFDLSFKKNVINDIHEDSINFLREIKNSNALKIFELMKGAKNTEEDYYFIRDKFEPKNNIEEAFKFFYLRKTCYRGMLRYNNSGKFNIPYGRYKTYSFSELLNSEYENLLKNTEIFNCDFSYIFERYNNNDNFMFLDPPYDSEFTNYGYCSFGKEDQVKLANLFKTTKNKCLLIIGETDFIKSLYKEYIVDSYFKKYSFKIHSGRIGEEIDNRHLIIKNY